MIFKNQHIIHLNESYRAWKPTSTRAEQRGQLCQKPTQRSRAPEGGRRENGERGVQGLGSRRSCSPDPERGREGEGTEPGTPGARSRRTEEGRPFP